MNIRHHPSDASLMAYGAGSLPEGLSLAVATHLAFCPICRSRVAEVEAMGGAWLEDIPLEGMADGALSAVLNRLDDIAPEPGRTTQPPTPSEAQKAPKDTGFPLPSPLAPYVGRSLDDGRWRRLAPGIREVTVIPRDAQGGNVRLLRIAPGRELPVHGHKGLEFTMVLSGSFTDELGRFGPGDIAETDDDVQHTPMSDTAEDCICLIATQAPLQFQGLAPRLLQPFFGL